MNKVILITGAGKGIGRAASLAFSAEGCSLSACSRTREDLESMAQKALHPEKILSFPGDASQPEVVEETVQKTLERFGRIDCLINNAGMASEKKPVHEVEISEWDAVLRTNLRAPFLWIKKILPHMIANNQGTIINLTSGASRGPAPMWGPYGISKLALEGLTRLVRQEIEGRPIRLIPVNPGATRTRMRADAYPTEDPSTLPPPSEIAKYLVWIMKNPAFNLEGDEVLTCNSYPPAVRKF